MASNIKQCAQRGAALVEFTITFMVFLIVILGIIEFSLVIFDASRLAEATRDGARYAITNNPACNIFGKDSADADSGCSPPNHPLVCWDTTTPPPVFVPDSVSVEIDSCSSPATTPGCKMVELMDKMMLRGSGNSVLNGSGKVRITYTCSQTGDPEIPRIVPVVTVEAIDVPHRMMFNSIFGFYSDDGSSIGPSITLPSFQTSRTGEDMFNR